MSNPRSIDDIKVAYQNLILQYGSGLVPVTKQLIWDGAVGAGTDYLGILAAEELVDIVSDSIEDAVAGGGATKIVIVGQGDDGLEITEEITLTGTTLVTSTKKFKVIYEAYASATEDESEITGPNHGNIKINETGEATHIMAIITETYGKSSMCFYKVPSNKFGKLMHVRFYPAAGKVATGYLLIRKNGEGTGDAWNGQLAAVLDYSAAVVDLRDFPKLLHPGAEIMLLGEVAATTGILAANFEIELEEL